MLFELVSAEKLIIMECLKIGQTCDALLSITIMVDTLDLTGKVNLRAFFKMVLHLVSYAQTGNVNSHDSRINLPGELENAEVTPSHSLRQITTSNSYASSVSMKSSGLR